MCILHISVLRCEQLSVDTVGALSVYTCTCVFYTFQFCVVNSSVLILLADLDGLSVYTCTCVFYTFQFCVVNSSVLILLADLDGLSVYTCTCVFYTFQFCVVNSSVLILLAVLRWFICIYMYMCILHISVLRCEQLGVDTVGGT